VNLTPAKETIAGTPEAPRLPSPESRVVNFVLVLATPKELWKGMPEASTADTVKSEPLGAEPGGGRFQSSPSQPKVI